MSVIPALQVERNRDGRTVSFFCPHCRRRHIHGAEGIEDGSRPHRLAHCQRADSPFAAFGYHLQLTPLSRAIKARAVAP